MKVLCPTRFVVDATENSKAGGVATDVCSSQAGLCLCTLQDIYTRIRAYYVRPNMFGEKKRKLPPPEVRSWDGYAEHVCKNSGSIVEKRREHFDLCGGNTRIVRSCM